MFSFGLYKANIFLHIFSKTQGGPNPNVTPEKTAYSSEGFHAPARGVVRFVLSVTIAPETAF